MPGRVTKEVEADGIRITARPSRWRALGIFVGSAALLIIAWLIFSSSENGPNPEGAVYFSGFLGVLACVLFLLGVQQIRKRIMLLVRDLYVESEQVGLFKKRRVWRGTEGEGYYLVLAYVEYKHRHKGNTSITRLSDLEVVDEEAKRTPLIRQFSSSSQLRQLANSLAEALKLQPPTIINLSEAGDDDTAYLKAHSQFLKSERDRHLGDMKDSVKELKANRDKMNSGRGVDNDIDEFKDWAVPEMDRAIASVEKEIQQAEFDVSLDNFNRCEFVTCRPGEIVEYHSLENTPSLTLSKILAQPGTTGTAILILMLTPIVVPLTGQLLVYLLGFLPFGVPRMQMHFALSDLFQLNLRVFLWAPFLIALWVVWTWLKVDASLAPFRVRFDWSTRKLTLQTRDATHQIPFTQIRALSIAIVYRRSVDRKKTSRHYGTLFAECVGKETALLELSRDASSPDDYEGTMDCFDPLASMLAESLNVSLRRIGWRREKKNVVGFPHSHRMFYGWSIYRLAGKSVRRWFLGSLFLAGLLFGNLVTNRFIANRAEAENYVATYSSWPPE